MTGSSLDLPDDESADPMRSADVAAALNHAYRLLERRQYPAVLDYLTPFRSATMSEHQKMRVHYALGTASARLGETRRAIELLDQALDVAERLEDLSACAMLAYLDAPLHYELSSISSAAEYYSLALDAIDTLRDMPSPADAGLELDVLVALSAQCFLLDRHDECARLLERARALTQVSPENRKRRADIEWMLALLERWRQRPYEALRHAQLALAEYRRGVGGINELARIELVVADIELDVAANLPFSTPVHGELTLLPHTDRHVADAFAHARVSGDRAAETMALLALARYDRMVHPGEDRTTTLDHALRFATDLHDPSVLGQVYSAMGDEMAGRGLFSQAVGLYRTALDQFATQEMVTLAQWARLGLRRAEEMDARE